VRRITTGSGKQRSTTENTLWEVERFVMHELLEGQSEQSAIPVEIQIPSNCRPSDERNPDDQTLWRLTVAAKVPGIDYSATFLVPVFETAASDPNNYPHQTHERSNCDVRYDLLLFHLIDHSKHAVAHNKIMVIDGQVVITASFNFTKAAEENNAENLLVIPSPELAKEYADNWQVHANHRALRRAHGGLLPCAPYEVYPACRVSYRGLRRIRELGRLPQGRLQVSGQDIGEERRQVSYRGRGGPGGEENHARSAVHKSATGCGERAARVISSGQPAASVRPVSVALPRFSRLP
jgi:hypothetical protein